ncbi:hypothetical protein J5N97_026555 [Dioscorea zingiberensis]|uniref:Uncharacterized protein n=1 Tax=Dioscorea zingiberensis TaxID=325984 RepID=A0A9D5H6X4_9LILI|nr:hypothetical protein J5N97_026555 [Dioscorea zingiberensis]
MSSTSRETSPCPNRGTFPSTCLCLYRVSYKKVKVLFFFIFYFGFHPGSIREYFWARKLTKGGILEFQSWNSFCSRKLRKGGILE